MSSKLASSGRPSSNLRTSSFAVFIRLILLPRFRLLAAKIRMFTAKIGGDNTPPVITVTTEGDDVVIHVSDKTATIGETLSSAGLARYP